MSKESDHRKSFNEGYQAGIVDQVGQDKARMYAPRRALRWPWIYHTPTGAATLARLSHSLAMRAWPIPACRC